MKWDEIFRSVVEERFGPGAYEKIVAADHLQSTGLFLGLLAAYYRLCKRVGPAKAAIVMSCIQKIPELKAPKRVRGKGRADPATTVDALVKRDQRERQQDQVQRQKIVRQFEEIERLMDKK
jgi:hypothetical protein